MTAIWRELILWEQFAEASEHQALLFESDKSHPTKSNPRMTAGIVREHDLIGRERHFQTVREKHERAWWAVSKDRKRRYAIALDEEGGWRHEVDEQ